MGDFGAGGHRGDGVDLATRNAMMNLEKHDQKQKRIVPLTTPATTIESAHERRQNNVGDSIMYIFHNFTSKSVAMVSHSSTQF